MRVQAPDTMEGLRALAETHERLVVYLTIDDCGPCHALWPQVEGHFAEDPDWALARVELERAPEIQGQMLVFSVPAVVVYFRGREVDRAARLIPNAWLVGARQRVDALYERFKD